MKKVRNKEGKITRIEFEASEFAAQLDVEPDELERWPKAIPALRKPVDGEAVYGLQSQEQLVHLRKLAAILRTGVSESGLKAIEEAGLLDAYAALAEDCPRGITVHAWRSYGVVVLMQERFKRKIDATELAERAKLREKDAAGKVVLGVETAKRHLRLLQALGVLRCVDIGDMVSGERAKKPRWEHQGLPKAWADKIAP